MLVDVTKLAFDPENPRLPEELHNAQADAIFEYLYDYAALEELASSMLDNGFFSHEPLIVLPAGADGVHVVVEGNRRLAALMLLHQLPPAGDRELAESPSKEQLQRLAKIPVVEVSSRGDVKSFLGYRHISGLKPWKPEAKARYLASEVDAASNRGISDPLFFVGRLVGSNSQGVRTYYCAYAILRDAQSRCGLNVRTVLSDRFGVWLRCMNSSEIRGYIGFGSPKDYAAIALALANLDCERLKEVVGDLSPGKAARAVLGDSRDVTRYGQVLSNEQAHALLRRYGDLDIAYEALARESLPLRVRALVKRADALREEIQSGLTEVDPDLELAVGELERSTRFLAAAVGALKAK